MRHARDETAGVAETYGRRARHYDRIADLYYAGGFRERAYRKSAIAAVEIQPGDTIVEIGCGTGRNFPHLRQAIGAEGRLIGVDLTAAMLEQADQRIQTAGWKNVELVHSDAAEYLFPDRVDGIISTFALSFSPRCGEVIQHGGAALAPGRCFAVTDMKMPPSPASWLMPLILPLVRPLAITKELIDERPWETIIGEMYRSLEDIRIEEWYLGMVYRVSARRAQTNQPAAGGGVTSRPR